MNRGHFKSSKIENLAKHILDCVGMIVIRILKFLHVDVEDLCGNLPSYDWGMVLIAIAWNKANELPKVPMYFTLSREWKLK